MSQQYVLIVFVGLMAYAQACGPAQQQSIDLLRRFFGIEPFYPNGEFNTTGYTDDFISAASDLNCNFNTGTESQTMSNGNPTQPSALCKWKNMKGERADLDDEQYYMFTRTGTKTWNSLRPSTAERRRLGKQTPAAGDGFALTGGKRKRGNRNLRSPQSVLYSAPLKCMEGEGELSFDYWLYSTARTQVLLLAQNTYRTLWTVDRRDACTSFKPRDGRCRIRIPPQAGPFHLAIHSYGLDNKFAIIDNIEFTGELGDKCIVNANPFDFGASSVSLPNRNGKGPIRTASDLDCPGGTNCKWSNTPGSEVKFESHRGPIDEERWREQTAGTSVPAGDYYFASGTGGRAELQSDVIACQADDGALTFKAWMSEGTILEVCVVNADTLEPLYTCEQVIRPMVDGSYGLPIFGPLENARILFVGSDWNAGNGGFVAIDDVAYKATMCSEVTTTRAPATTTQSNDEIDAEACRTLTTNFERASAAGDKWRSYSANEYQGIPLIKHSIDDTFPTAQNTRIKCVDSGRCAGAMLSKAGGPQLTIMESKTFRLRQERFLRMNTHRGTYGTTIHVCVNELPDVTVTGKVRSSRQCEIVSGPGITYTEFRQGKVTGIVLPSDAEKVYIIFSNPADSGADRAAFLVDSIQLLRGTAATSGPLCEFAKW